MGDGSSNSTMRAMGKPLSAAFVRTVSEPGKYHDRQNTGLILQVDRNNRKYWKQRIVINGRRRELGIGNANFVSLADAREKAWETKRSVVAGRDPFAEKRALKERITFAEATEKALLKRFRELTNEKHKKQWQSTLERYAFPVIGAMRVSDIETQHILKVLSPIWEQKTETATRLRARIEVVLNWATVSRHRSGDNPARWKGNLSELLASPSKVAQKSNHPAVQMHDLGRWWSALSERDGMAAKALQFLAMTAARSGEIRGMVWQEIDFERALWTIPAERMKANREHRVPLSERAAKLLNSMPRLVGSDFVFFAPQGGALADMSISAVMKRLHKSDIREGGKGFLDRRSGRPAVPHGLRSSFRDWAAEQGVDRNLAEICLAHKVGSEVERAYLRSDMVERRRGVMQDWQSFLSNSLKS
ncbi:MAG: tyrosine-type recombinase/integrase [Henriciella sp.]|nr:tyrosine-type recombinase/integrase [Henriciella sp.]MBO6694965.1 tyrosine-type recombinase/integrase [Henriciella sp.]